ncbi:MAG: aspartate 1-decarboxylase, partial [Candidatus Hydrogenedentes bacterium]|nr:aspartate 1-decarboxylase [Candidatus Hydrogenedentota bacterium]
ILVNEKVLVVDINNGERFETYVIEGERGSGTVCLNGAAARLGHVGDIVIIMTFCLMDQEEAKQHRPRTVLVDERNRGVDVK